MISKLFTHKKELLHLVAILLISTFFRTYDLTGRYGFDHDAELFSWIVKDIVIDDHPRLIGQLTSASGIFIGPLFYYSLIPFFLLFNMDPIGAVIPITIIGVLTTFSYYVVFKKLFNSQVGLVAAFYHAMLFGWIPFDRRVVPSTPANIWMVWYVFCVIQISRGQFTVLPILGILLGLIWHIHIALLPTLLALPVAFLVAKKLPNKKNTSKFLISLFITSLPLILFETRHNFSQTMHLFNNFTIDHGGGKGLPKLIYLLEMVVKNINNLLIAPQNLPDEFKPYLVLIFIVIGGFLLFKKIISTKEIFPLLTMTIGVLLFFSLSSTLVSEYYLYSMEILFVIVLSLFTVFLLKQKSLKVIVLSLMILFMLRNAYFYTTNYVYKKGYLERKGVVEYIMNDAKEKSLPCFGVSYITSIGENTGFRYFFYLKNAHLIRPAVTVPVYNIVLPEELSKEVEKKFEHIGVITPKNIPDPATMQQICKAENINLTDPMFGFVN